ncbi:MAG: hypothetical protein FHK80_00480 [Azoarcus sp. PHD]|nr:MAG: hypothetical protein FHK80_00480 [Azoarcus sp. PHD]
MNTLPTAADERRDLVMTTLAKVLAGVQEIDTAAAITSATPDQLLEILDSEEGGRAVVSHLARMRDSGELLKAQALAPLEKLVSRIDEQIDAGAVSVSTAAKLMDTLLKLSGLAEERAARLRAQAADDTPKMNITICYKGEEPPAGMAEHSIVIRFPTTERPGNRTIDITPTKGGDDGDE